MPTRFHKMHGAGNDFVLLDLRAQDHLLDPQVARQLGDRKTGIGFDQLLALYPPEQGGIARFTVWNADGSQAEQCGNGVRAIALYLSMNGDVDQAQFYIEGVAGPVTLQNLADGQVRAGMGSPAFDPGQVPTTLDSEDGRYLLEVDGQHLHIRAVSMGNPHAVLTVDNVDTAPVERLGPGISTHPGFPEGCNAGFAQVLDRSHIRLRVFERGADETRACGSGACAAAVSLHRAGRLDDRVMVDQAGGRLIIEIDGEAGSVNMTGPAAHVFEGTLT